MTNKPVWSQICEFLVRRRQKRRGMGLPERPAPDLAQNDGRLARISDNDPTYRALMDYAYSSLENNLAPAFDAARPMEQRICFVDRAAGIMLFIDLVEGNRERLKAELRKQADEKTR